jgi:hypothetical protein
MEQWCFSSLLLFGCPVTDIRSLYSIAWGIRSRALALELSVVKCSLFFFNSNSSKIMHLYNTIKKYRKPSTSGYIYPVILATWKAEIKRIMVQDQLRNIVCKTPK